MDFKDENIELSKLNINDLNHILNKINEYDLELRNSLNFNNNVTFGIEIESEFADVDKINFLVNANNLDRKWLLKDDFSLDRGIEIASPILKDEKKSYEEIKTICNIFKKYSMIGANCGGHIHIGSQILENEENLKKLINFWTLYEHIIYRFTNGEYLNARPSLNIYAAPLRYVCLPNNFTYNKYNVAMVDSAIRICNISSYNTQKLRNTIEFRSPNGTLNEVIWQNNINLFVKMIEKIKNIDIDELYYKYYDCFSISTNEYNKIYFKDAINFTDIVFDNLTDKIYFLSQYFKNNQTSDKYIKAKKFIK